MAMERTADFTEEVQKYDCLYNKFSKDYKNKYTKMNCWAKIAEKFDMSAEEAEKKFKNIRTAYGRYLKKVKSIPSGSGRDAVPLPKEFVNLDWLAGFISSRPCISNLRSNDADEDHAEVEDSEDEEYNTFTELGGEESELNVSEEIVDDGDDLDSPIPGVNNDGSTTSSGSSSVTTPLQLQGKPRGHVKNKPRVEVEKQSQKKNKPWAKVNKKATKEEVDVVLLRTASTLAESLKQLPDRESVKRRQPNDIEDDEDSLFCRSLAPRLRRLPQRAKYFARMQIEQMLFQAEFAATEPVLQAPNHQMSYPGMGSCHVVSLPVICSFLTMEID